MTTVSYDNVTGLGFHVQDVEKKVDELEALVEQANQKIILLTERIRELEQHRIQAR